jgi:hypothetical protein
MRYLVLVLTLLGCSSRPSETEVVNYLESSQVPEATCWVNLSTCSGTPAAVVEGARRSYLEDSTPGTHGRRYFTCGQVTAEDVELEAVAANGVKVSWTAEVTFDPYLDIWFQGCQFGHVSKELAKRKHSLTTTLCKVDGEVIKCE